jgi:hypothetical protein
VAQPMTMSALADRAPQENKATAMALRLMGTPGK